MSDLGEAGHDRSGAVRPATSQTELLQAWEQLRYGMFIHYGMSTFTGDEYGRTAAPSTAYAPTALDVDQWIRTARDAGMRYAVLTAKHCYGHCLWPSATTDYTVAANGGSADVVALFVEACRKYDVRPGLYYLLGWDMHHQVKMDPTEYEQFVRAQLSELLTNYGDLTELWLDIPADLGAGTAGMLERLYAHIKALQPGCLALVNQAFVDGSSFRVAEPTWCGKPVGGAAFPLWPTDILNGERVPPPEAGHDPWKEHDGARYYVPMEVSDSLGQSMWFWGPDDDVRPASVVFALYQQSVGRNANLLLNVAPDRSGRIPDAAVDRLLEVKRMIDAPLSGAAREPLTRGRPARASNVYRGDPAWGPQMAVDLDLGPNGGTRWATDEGATEAWLEVDLGGEKTLDGAFVSEFLDRVEAFVIEVPSAGGGWRTIHEGTRIGGPGVTVAFEPVAARAVRLRITKATVGPTIWSFEVYGKP